MDISFIIVSWNAKDYLAKCLTSVINDVKNLKYEIIVVDNGSSDGSPEFVRKEFPSVKLISNGDNYGFAKANNIGIGKSLGKYLYLINSDIEVLNGCINKVFDYMEKNGKTGMASPRILNPDMTNQVNCKRIPTLWNIFCRALLMNRIFPDSKIFPDQEMKKWHFNKTAKVEVLNGCFWAIRKDSLNDVGLMDELFFIYGEDVDWCKRFRDAGWDVVFYPEAEAIHYKGASSSNAPLRFYLESQKANLQFWKKHYSKISVLLFNMIMLLYHSVRIFIDAVMIAVNFKKYSFLVRRHFFSILWQLKIYKVKE